MSDEIKSLKDYISTTKNEIFTTFKIETISNLIIYYEDLQQKVEQLEKESFQLKMDWVLVKSALDTSEKRVEQLENIRKEAIEECKSVIGNPEHAIVSKNELMKILLNILNKRSDKE